MHPISSQLYNLEAFISNKIMFTSPFQLISEMFWIGFAEEVKWMECDAGGVFLFSQGKPRNLRWSVNHKYFGLHFWKIDRADLMLFGLMHISHLRKGNRIFWIWAPYMGSSAQDGENEQYLALFFFFGALLWPNGLFFWSFVNCSEEILTVGI